MTSTEGLNKRLLVVVEEKDRGGPEKLKLVSEDVPIPNDNQVLISIKACGVNFIDTYHRTGLYPGVTQIGKEGSGVIVSVGKNVKQFQVGQSVCWWGIQGSYSTHVCADPNDLMPIPEKILKTHKDTAYIYAAAIPLQGLTAHYLCRSVYRVGEKDTILVHAGAGGTGGLLIQICKKILKCHCVITTVGSEEKIKVALQNGADHVINYTKEDFFQKVYEYTKGQGCNVVFDGVGKATWEKSLKCVRALGMIVYFGNASGKVPPIDPLDLMKQGSVSMIRPNLTHFVATAEVLQERARELFEWIESNWVDIKIGAKFALKDVTKAHQLLESRDVTAKIVLIP